MTTSERLRRSAQSGDSPVSQNELELQAADELDQRDDTIAQLRAERDAFQRERDLLRAACQAALDWCTGDGVYANGNDTTFTLAEEVAPKLEAALKGETTK